ncbi:amino acid adenylation domain-containing protein [Streptomyces sp. BK208]|uniref:non-ribosomal peptide synthetase n=1 Tax=Streptomyces sp. BK208 TaxID=2512150 RepID=UPI0010CF5047|nr:non-ribosomal peptide synthetase [Streptomyces sp. BK208]TDT22739.1 amino acid adenylation domain-containing protein [Streptomyces sp. BK208]
MNASASPESAFPSSFAQRRLWFVEQLVPGTAQHHLGMQFRVTGTIDVDALAWSVNRTVARHEALRTRFGTIDGSPVQVVAAEGAVGVDTFAVESDADVDTLVTELVRKPFDLARPPLLRVALVRGPSRTVLVFVVHHIISDAWSVGILASEVAESYRTRLAGGVADLPELSVQYVDFTQWQRERTDTTEYAEYRRAWADMLRGAPQSLDLPFDRPRPPVQTFAGGSVTFEVPPNLKRRLDRVSEATGATTFMTLLAAYFVVLARLSGERDLLVASPTAGRTQVETEQLIGFFANTLVLRSHPSDELAFDEYLKHVRECCLAAFTHQEVPFEHLVEDLSPERTLDRNPLVQAMFILQNAPAQTLRLPGVVLEPVEIDTGTSQFDLTLNLTPEEGGLTALIQFSTELFDPSTVERFAGYYLAVLHAVAEDPSVRLDAIDLLGDAERARLAALGTGPDAPSGRETVPDALRRIAAEHPERIAVAAGETRWTYRELLGHADAVAGALSDLGVAPGDLVGVCLPRGPEMVSALLGVWGAGAAYVPLDPDYPRARLEYMVRQSGLTVLLTTHALAAVVPLDDTVRVAFIDDVAPHDGPRPEAAPTAPDALAYVIYTSGSTGRPKGVMIEHGNLANVVHGFVKQPGLGAEDRMLAVTSLSFDIAGLELFAPLMAGGRLVVAEAGVGGDPERLHRLLAQHAITVVQATPATWKAYAGHVDAVPGTLRQIWCGGEEVSLELADRLLALGVRLWNVYGPTETTIWSTCTEMTAGTQPSIGSPVVGTRLFVVDGAGRPVPTGVPGELWIAGSGVGRGYLGLPELTAERFVEGPDGTRAYRTGDLVRWASDGGLRFMGRMDHQVKVRGYRIELAEIDTTMRDHPQIRDSLTVVRKLAGGEDGQLVTFLVPDSDAAPDVEAGTPTAAEAVETWRGLWDEIYQQGSEPEQGDLNIKGWTSSYTKEPLTDKEMRHWVDATVDAIAATGARTYCEIGCGTGLLLLRLAQDSTHYLGIDLAAEAVAHVTQQAKLRGLDDRAELVLGSAEDLPAIAGNRRFDCVVINSVAQYFPDENYLTRTLTTAVSLVRPGGHVFVGDLRHRGLAQAFHASVLHHQGVADRTLALRAAARAAEEEELLVDPGYFTRLREKNPAVTGVQISLKPGGPDNELTRFRYDVLLRVNEPVPAPVSGPGLDWDREVGSLSHLADILAATDGELVVDGIPNARVARFARLLHPLDAAEEAPGVLPEDLTTVAAAHGLRTHHEWSVHGTGEGRIRALFHRRTAEPPAARPFLDSRPPVIEPVVNSPGRAALLRSLPLAARSWARSTLPEHMIPQLVRALPALPLTPNGKMDRNALVAMITDHVPSSAPALPTGELEGRIHSVWCDVLGLPRVGVTENFFDAGGTSMSVVRVRQELRKRHGIDLPMTAFFAHPTIASLAAHLADGPSAREERERRGAQRRQAHSDVARRRRGRRNGD